MNPFLIMEGDIAGREVGQVWTLNPTRMHQLFSVIRELLHFSSYFLFLIFHGSSGTTGRVNNLRFNSAR
jgi:hypothetical protein